jgi:tripartite-type tricarboxylate transporter receptor subunit TctC
MQRRNLTLALATSAIWPAATLRAQPTPAWPDKAVRFVLSQPAGSGPDAIARLIVDRLSKTWSQSVWIDNKPGGQNVIGAQAAARSAPDGTTLYFATTAALVTNSFLFKQLPYNPQKDFVPVAFIARSPFALLVEINSPLKSLQDFVDRAKSAPGKLSLGNEGPRTFGGIISRLFAAREQIELNQVAYPSVAVALQDTIGGHVEAVLADVPSSAALVKAGKLRALAVTTAKRLPGLESVPALAETLPGFDMVGWFAVVAPTGTPQAAIQRANHDINALLNEREFAERIALIGPMADGSMSVDQVGAFLQSERARWEAATKEIGVLPE